ncbi:hypothetical protein K469DRAFT_672170 [Zopfia rhizophila CBS 207.26]|uniref:Uncharacterized protein n=1 Tax=Zopfia rhizophila CBS 207.26 TaxID=1314779 RepID=A0A6A6DMP7_9PEZI|nr:hypothetical protein K469DRAFT_672170 [Zopfia rhizophila CBS 207.26]
MRRTNTPKRIVLRFDVEYELEEAAINERFFALFSPKPVHDFYSHLIPPNESSKMHIVLDLHCKINPVVNIHAIAYEVFKVEKSDEFDFEKLNSAACEVARLRCNALSWGTDRRYPEELDGDRLAHIGHSPSRLVSRAPRRTQVLGPLPCWGCALNLGY